MPPITSQSLTERLLRRLEHNLPHALAAERTALSSALAHTLADVLNGSLDRTAAVPAGGIRALGADGSLQTLHAALTRPCGIPDLELQSLSTSEHRAIRFVGHLRDIHLAGEDVGERNIALLVAQRERRVTFDHLKAEIMRELGTLPYPHAINRAGKREEVAASIAKELLARCEANRVIPTDARLFGFRELAPVADQHAGGITGFFAAWNADAPPPLMSLERPAGVDKPTAQTHAPDPAQAPSQVAWTGVVPLAKATR